MDEERTAPHVSEPTPPSDEHAESFFKEIIKFALIAFLIVVPIRWFVAQPFIVSGDSMYPTFESGQYLIIDQLSYRLEEPVRGEVIVFKYPEDESKFFIKRIVGLPGETVEIRDGRVLIRDEGGEMVLEEPYVGDEFRSHEFLTRKLGPDEYFVLGDNRPASSDSRSWGPLPEDLIVGRAIVRLLPVSDVGLWPGNATNDVTSQ